jgi:hypothetical protein
MLDIKISIAQGKMDINIIYITFPKLIIVYIPEMIGTGYILPQD